MERNELIKEKFYKDKRGFWFKLMDLNSDKNPTLKRETYFNDGATLGIALEGPYQELDLESSHWLQCCIDANKFVSKTQAMKSFTPQFEVGKWYKDISSVPYIYIKFEWYCQDKIYSSERIIDWVYKSINNDHWDALFRNWQALSDLSEIQQYLPNGHVDKIKLKISREELLDPVNKYVVYLDSEEEWKQLNLFLDFAVTSKWWGKHCYKPTNYSFCSASSLNNSGSYNAHKILFLKELDIKSSMLSKEELLEQAKKKYPIGTTIYSALRGDRNPAKVRVDKIGNLDIVKGRQIIWNIQNGDLMGFLYDDGKWAEIVSLPEELPKEKKTTLNKKYKEEVVHCTTQEEWNFVCEKVNAQFSQNWFKHISCGNNKSYCIVLENKTARSQSLQHFQKKDSTKIYSFQEWCDKFNHKFESNKSETMKKEEWIPEVGEYAVMENAGGWSYSPINNGCIAKIESVSTRIITNYIIGGEQVYTIDGVLLNPKVNKCTTFKNVPISGNNGKHIICRKALPHEIIIIKTADFKDIGPFYFGADPYKEYPLTSKECFKTQDSQVFDVDVSMY